MKYYVYIILCKNGGLYTGIATDVKRRFIEHKIGKGSSYTKANKPVKILYTEEHPNRSSALKREVQIKRWRRKEKLDLIKFGKTKNS